jgi:hypothetical protein
MSTPVVRFDGVGYAYADEAPALVDVDQRGGFVGVRVPDAVEADHRRAHAALGTGTAASVAT